MDTKTIINAIDAYAASSGLAPATICNKAVGNSRLYATLKAGGSCTLRIADRLLAYIAEHSAETPPSRRSV